MVNSFKWKAEKYFECYRFSKIRCYLNILTRIQLIQLAYPFYIEATRTYANDAWIKRNLCGVEYSAQQDSTVQ